MNYNFHSICTGNCPWNEFPCSNGKCIPHLFKCDGMDNCGDRSDESNEDCQNGNNISVTKLIIDQLNHKINI